MPDDRPVDTPDRDEQPDIRLPMVNWLSPLQLAKSGLKVVMAGVFGQYLDHREVQAAIDNRPDDRRPCDGDYSAASELWIDHVADVGDGFDSTYAVAWLLSRPSLEVDGARLPRGQVLLLGGDQVYPTASRSAYQERFQNPYRLASPDRGSGPGADLYAVPGNHDWYDGLTNFLRLFCQRRRIGDWQTRQTRSYYWLKLPGHWHLWGVDVQLESYIDYPQLRYFEQAAREIRRAADEDGVTPRVILCTPEPTWVYSGNSGVEPRSEVKQRDELRIDRDSYASLSYFEGRVIRANHLRLALVIAGDLHHYARYEQVGVDPASDTQAPPPLESQESAVGVPRADEGPDLPRQRVTCGGGGAYFYPTHHLPAQIELNEKNEARVDRLRTYERRKVYPSAECSRALGNGIWSLPFRNWDFALMLGAIHALLAWILQSASLGASVLEGAGIMPSAAGSMFMALSTLGPADGWRTLAVFERVASASPAAVGLALALVGGLWGFRGESKTRRWSERAWGIGHGLAHLVLALVLIWAVAWGNATWIGDAKGLAPGWSPRDASYLPVFALEVVVLGGFLGGLLFAAYLWLSARFTDQHHNEVYSAQGIADHKCFLRLRIRPEGVTVHAIGVPAVPTTWTGEKRDTPPGGNISTELIERFEAL